MNRIRLISTAVIIAAITASCGVTKNNTGNKNKTTTTTVVTQKQNSSKISSDALAGEWTVYTVGGNKVTGETRPYINFNKLIWE